MELLGRLAGREQARAAAEFVPAAPESRHRPEPADEVLRLERPRMDRDDLDKTLREGISAPDRAAEETARNTAALVAQLQELLNLHKRRGALTPVATAVGPE
jgi:hypothetical protein